MSLVRFNPRYHLNTMLREMMDYSGQTGGDIAARLPLDAYATDNEIVVTAALPGVRPEDVEVILEGGALTIRGQVQTSREENANYILREHFYGAFSRTLQVNVPVNADRVEASFENGMLTVVLPKADEVKPKQINVKAGK